MPLVLELTLSWASFKALTRQSQIAESSSSSAQSVVGAMSAYWPSSMDAWRGEVQETGESDDSEEDGREEVEHLLRMWCCVAVLKLYEAYVEKVVAVLPLYSSLKSIAMIYVLMVRSDVLIRALFDDVLAPRFMAIERIVNTVRQKVNDALLSSLKETQDRTWSGYLRSLSNEDVLQWKAYLESLLNAI